MDLDLFMLIRETAFIIIAVPLFYLSVDSLLRLRKRKLASSRIFLRGKLLLKASRSLVLSTPFGLIGAVALLFWSMNPLEVYRVTAGCSLIVFLTLILYFTYCFRNVLKG
ncbi:hypothetical protein B6U84_04745 [Candidatus Bathyarchaeota archaeon ex4484_40]|nr:MAG: hypothetical protein B6U84_04745 [Candidatus Bathyarchaeota archaeon ex4484_40]